MNSILNSNVFLVLSFLNFIFWCNTFDDGFIKDDHSDVDADEYQYDHHVILGRDQSALYDKLSPEESKAKLSDIIDKMDLDHDGKINMLELKSWIKNVFSTILNEDVDTQWKDVVKQDLDKIDFETYLKNAFKGGVNEGKRPLIKIEERRWLAADLDKDNLLNKTELFRFLHPEEFKDLKPLLAQESLEELDKNKDGFIDIDEYMKDLFPEGRQVREEWIRHERQNFGTERDLNKDGFLDRDEVQNWLLPESYDRVEAEAEHLMDKAGAGDDRVLTKQAMLTKYQVFVGTGHHRPYGDYLNHEDL